MNLSKEITMRLLEMYINKINDLEGKNEKLCLKIEAEILCLQKHLKGFEK